MIDNKESKVGFAYQIGTIVLVSFCRGEFDESETETLC